MYILTVIIPHYNSITSLKKLLSSIPRRKDIEVIIVDDKSEPHCQEELIKLSKQNFIYNLKILHNLSNKKGAGASRNIALREVNSKWLLFADADDYFLSEGLTELSEFMNSKADVIFFTPTSIDLTTNEISDRHEAYAKLIKDYKEIPNDLNKVKLLYTYFVPWSKLIKTEIVKENNLYFDEVIASNDVMFSAKLGSLVRSFEVCETPFYCVTRDKGTLTTTLNEKVFKARLDVSISHYKFLRKNIDKNHLRQIGPSSRWFLIYSLKFGLTYFLKVFIKLVYHRIPIIEKKIFNPMWFYRMSMTYYKNYRKMKDYVSK